MHETRQQIISEAKSLSPDFPINPYPSLNRGSFWPVRPGPSDLVYSPMKIAGSPLPRSTSSFFYYIHRGEPAANMNSLRHTAIHTDFLSAENRFCLLSATTFTGTQLTNRRHSTVMNFASAFLHLSAMRFLSARIIYHLLLLIIYAGFFLVQVSCVTGSDNITVPASLHSSSPQASKEKTVAARNDH